MGRLFSGTLALLREHEAERMTRGVEEDAKARAGLHLRFTRTQSENLLLGDVEVGDVEVEVGLLRPPAARPYGCLMVRCKLEGERHAAVAPQLYPLVVAVFDLPARDRAVELGQFAGLAAVERHNAESCDGSHAGKSRATRPLALPEGQIDGDHGCHRE